VRDYIRLSGVLLIVCVIAAALLGFTNDFTAEKIVMQISKANDEARKAVLPEADEFEKVDDATLQSLKSNPDFDTVVEIYNAKAAGAVIGYAVKTAPKGYGGAVEVIVGVGADGVVKGVQVGNNTETPGLGKNAEKPKFKDQYNNKTWDMVIDVIKSGTPKDNQISAIAGSTITSRGVTKGVNQAMAIAKELAGK